MPEKVLITGGAGFIGSHVAQALSSRGFAVRLLDSLSPQIHGQFPTSSRMLSRALEAAELIRADVRNQSELKRALEGVRTVVHLAAETGTGQSMYDISRYVSVNIDGTAALLDLIAEGKTSVEKVIVASSRAVYGEGTYHCGVHGTVSPGPRSVQDMQRGRFELYCPRCGSEMRACATAEDAPVRPASVYGVTKCAQEQLAMNVCVSIGISGISFRFQNVYGPGQSLKNPYTGILSIFTTRLRNHLPISVFEDGLESRDFVYIDDVVTAVVRAIEKPERINDVYNVGSGTPTDVNSLAALLSTAVNGKSPIEINGRFRVGDIRHNWADLTKVEAELGFHPSVSVKDGIERFATWALGEALETDRYEQSMRELAKRGLYR